AGVQQGAHHAPEGGDRQRVALLAQIGGEDRVADARLAQVLGDPLDGRLGGAATDQHGEAVLDVGALPAPTADALRIRADDEVGVADHDAVHPGRDGGGHQHVDLLGGQVAAVEDGRPV